MSNRLERRALNKALRPAANVLLKLMRALVPRGVTGNLYKSLRIREISQRLRFMSLAIGAGRSRTHPGYHATMVEYGTKAHPIAVGFRKSGKSVRPTGKRVLSSGSQTFGTRAQSPGTRPRPFVRPAFALAKEQMLDIIAKNIGEDIKLELKSRG